MDGILQTVIIVFMAFLCALCLFAVVVIVRDIISENATTKRSIERNRLLEETLLRDQIMAVRAKEEVSAVVEEPVKEQVKVQETVVEEVAVAQVNEEEKDDNEVTFQTKALSMEEKFDMMSSEFKDYFNEIAKYASAKEGVKEHRLSGSYDYKIGAYKVVRMSIKRGEIVCEFTFIDRDLRNYASKSNVKMKQSATVIRVLETSAVGVVKDGIDRVCAQIAEDKEYKKELAKEKRREKRRLAKEGTV